MPRERLIEIVDLILQCERLGYDHAVMINIDNWGHHYVSVYPNVGRGGNNTHYFCNESEIETSPKHGFVYDPDFKVAEAEIRKLLEKGRTI